MSSISSPFTDNVTTLDAMTILLHHILKPSLHAVTHHPTTVPCFSDGIGDWVAFFTGGQCGSFNVVHVLDELLFGFGSAHWGRSHGSKRNAYFFSIGCFRIHPHGDRRD